MSDETSEMPSCPEGRSAEFVQGWAAYYLGLPFAESNPYRQGDRYERWSVGWQEAQSRHEAAKADTPAKCGWCGGELSEGDIMLGVKCFACQRAEPHGDEQPAPAEVPPCPNPAHHSKEYAEGWEAFFDGTFVNPYHDCIESGDQARGWSKGFNDARERREAEEQAEQPEQPASVLPRVIWEGAHPITGLEFRVVLADGDRFVAERHTRNAMGNSNWNPHDMTKEVLNALAFEYLRKLAGEEKGDDPAP